MNDMATGEPETVEEFLGVEQRPRWRRWMKYWLPALVILLLVLYFSRGGDAQPQYITEEVVQRSLDIEVTATGNLDSERSIEIMEFLAELNKTGITILMVTHEADMAAFAKTIVHFKDGLVERTERGHRQGAPV